MGVSKEKRKELDDNLEKLKTRLKTDEDFYNLFRQECVKAGHNIGIIHKKYNIRLKDIGPLKKEFRLNTTVEESVAKFKASRNNKTVEEEALIVDKRRKTCLEKYGVSSIQFVPEVQEKKKQTFLNNYGVDHPMKAEAIKQKSKETCLERYGHEYVLQLEEVKEKGKQTKLKLYGDPNYNNREQHIQTCYERYGVDYPAKIPEIKEKVRATCLEKYGVEWTCMRPEARNYSSNDSKPNSYFADKLTEKGISFTREFPIKNRSFDFKVESTLIEINPTATHNSTFGIFGEPKEKDYHFNKSKIARENGFRCIHVWDWEDTNKIISLLLPRETIYARKCELKEVSKENAKLFINTYHLQGHAKDEIRLGLYYNNELVSIMTFGKPRYNKNYQYELIRYCSSKKVIGGAEKLFKHFIKDYNPESIISYCDYSKFNGITYEKLGFSFKNVAISKHWYNPRTERHITDNLLRAQGVDHLLGTDYGKGTPNQELMLLEGFVEIYDAGQAVYEYRR